MTSNLLYGINSSADFLDGESMVTIQLQGRNLRHKSVAESPMAAKNLAKRVS
jgi:hypothetical protein